MKQKALLLMFGLFLANFVQAQVLTQTIRGQIVDADTRQPLVGATVDILNTEMGATTNDGGHYRLETVPVGRYRLRISYLGYDVLEIPEVLVESGKELVLDMTLTESSTDLETVLVQASRSDTRTFCPTVKTLTVEETLRFPATFFDPARLVTTFAGVVNDNDQANGISIRGNSPNGLLWQLEGLDIVNPNHTPNAGTFSDRITQNGGGVNILSAQLLSTSYFYTGAFPADYGNALSGVMDMRLRRGNNQQQEFTGQAGLIGLELATEGPFSMDNEASYLVNYRYSTVALLDAMGLELGDESITFQDLSFNLVFPMANGGSFTLFGMGGLSENVFKAERDSTTWEFEKDGQDITFESQMAAIGTTLELPVGQAGRWRNAVGFSGLESRRLADDLNAEYTPIREEEDDNNQSKISLHSVYHHKFSANARLRAGLVLTQQDFDIRSLLGNVLRTQGKGGGLLWQPYLGWQSRLGAQLDLNLGLHYTYFGFNGSNSLDPRASLEWRPNNQNSLSFSYGLHSQLQLPQLYFAQLSEADNSDLGLNRAHHLVLAYQRQLGQATEIRGEAFFQSLFDIPVSGSRSSAFSALNLLEGFVTEKLVNEGTGQNYGLEISLRQYMSNNIYYLLNATWYESTYKGSDGVERNTRYNGNYILNLTGGKEWRWRTTKKGKDRLLGVNGRIAMIGGYRDSPIDMTASAAAGTTVYDEEDLFSIQQDAFFRLDLRIYYTRNKPKHSSTLSLDIQNTTNAENMAYTYYDTFQKTLVQKNQLGIIPNLSYRISF
ncbi:MAG: prevent-host-death protein [Saprospiraceae bacterium]|nr:MAG: prevent-host-death protein [Saprospiraceae bacterium]